MSQSDSVRRKKAAALKYDPDKNGAPVIVASGMGYIAEKITETAMKAGVPVYEDDSLASLLTQLKLGAETVVPDIRPLGADLGIAMELSESLKAVRYIKPGGTLVVYGYKWMPTAVMLGKAPYPTKA